MILASTGDGQLLLISQYHPTCKGLTYVVNLLECEHWLIWPVRNTHVYDDEHDDQQTIDLVFLLVYTSV